MPTVFAANAQLINDLGDEAMDDAMGAARTIVGMGVGKRLGFLNVFSHYKCSFTTSMISSGVGTSPPHLPYQCTGSFAQNAALHVFHHLAHAHLDAEHGLAAFFSGGIVNGFQFRERGIRFWAGSCRPRCPSLP
jgi:hypothetical protein